MNATVTLINMRTSAQNAVISTVVAYGERGINESYLGDCGSLHSMGSKYLRDRVEELVSAGRLKRVDRGNYNMLVAL